MRLRDIIEDSEYWIKCENIYEQRKLMIRLDNILFKHNDMRDWKNDGNLFQSDFYKFDENIYFNLTRSGYVYWRNKEKIKSDRIIKFCDIEDMNTEEILNPNELLNYSVSPKEINNTMSKLIFLEDNSREKFLLDTIKELINKVNYLESYIITNDIKDKERIQKQEENRRRNITASIRSEEEFYKNVYYMSDDHLRAYINKNIAGDDWNRQNEFWRIRKKACDYMGNHEQSDFIERKILKDR